MYLNRFYYKITVGDSNPCRILAKSLIWTNQKQSLRRNNIRELKNHVRRAVLFCRNGELTPDDLSPAIVAAASRSSANGNGNGNGNGTLSEKVATSEREILEDALRANNFKRTATAESLGISRVGLYKKMKKYSMLDMKRATE